MIAGIERLGIAPDGVLAIDDRVLAREVRLVEVVGMLHVNSTHAWLHDDGRIGADQHGNAARPSGRPSVAFLVQGDITGDDDGCSAIPAGRLDPIDGIEQRIRPTVAGIDGVDTFDAGIPTGGEELHQDRLDRLRLVQQRLRTHLQTADGGRVDGVSLQQRRDGRQRKRIDI